VSTPEHAPRSCHGDSTLTALRLLAVAAKRYRVAESSVAAALGEEAFLDDGSGGPMTLALEEQAEALGYSGRL